MEELEKSNESKTTIIEAPILGRLTAREWHNLVVGAIVALYIGLTKSADQIRKDPWYFLAGTLLGFYAAKKLSE